MIESSKNKQERFHCHVGFGVDDWNCYADCMFWSGGICTNYEIETACIDSIS